MKGGRGQPTAEEAEEDLTAQTGMDEDKEELAPKDAYLTMANIRHFEGSFWCGAGYGREGGGDVSRLGYKQNALRHDVYCLLRCGGVFLCSFHF